MKLSGERLLQVIGAAPPPIAICASLNLVAAILPTYSRLFHDIDGDKPLPSLTLMVLKLVHSPIPLQWLGIAMLIALLFVACLTIWTANSSQIAFKRLFLLVTVEWALVWLFLVTVAIALALPTIPIVEPMQ